jgi:hypothetical protein
LLPVEIEPWYSCLKKKKNKKKKKKKNKKKKKKKKNKKKKSQLSNLIVEVSLVWTR